MHNDRRAAHYKTSISTQHCRVSATSTEYLWLHKFGAHEDAVCGDVLLILGGLLQYHIKPVQHVNPVVQFTLYGKEASVGAG